MSVLLALVLSLAPGCPEALAGVAALPDDLLAARAPTLAGELEDAGAGPAAALRAAAGRLAGAAEGSERSGAAAAFRGALTTHCTFAAAPAEPVASAAERAALADVLARPELSHARLDPWAIRRALVRLWDWLLELLGTQEAERYASLGRALFLGTAAAALTLGLSALRRRARAAPAGARRAEEPAAAQEPAPDGAARADEALRRGEAREAIRFALLAALGGLERAGWVPRGRALTNEELVGVAFGPGSPRGRAAPGPGPTARARDQVQDQVAAAAMRSDLALLARAFDRAVYGGLPATAEEARGAVERARRLLAAACGAIR